MALPKLNTVSYELELPSTGESVKFRPFLVKEEKILLDKSDEYKTIYQIQITIKRKKKINEFEQFLVELNVTKK